VRPFDETAEGVRDLEPAFVIDFGGVVAPEHVSLLHFLPQNSTAIVENDGLRVNAKPTCSGCYAFVSPRRKAALAGVRCYRVLAWAVLQQGSGHDGPSPHAGVRDPECGSESDRGFRTTDPGPGIPTFITFRAPCFVPD
jgi:hypothetical protein